MLNEKSGIEIDYVIRLRFVQTTVLASTVKRQRLRSSLVKLPRSHKLIYKRMNRLIRIFTVDLYSKGQCSQS